MKTVTAAVFALSLVLSGFSISMASEGDMKGSQDHPLLSRMPDFHISDYKYH